jgi:hypothetical protein
VERFFFQPPEIHRQHGEPLIDVIVQVPGNPPAVRFLRREELAGQGLQILPALPQLPLARLQHRLAGPQRGFRIHALLDLGHERPVHRGQFLCPRLHAEFQLIMRPLQPLLRTALMEEEQHREPDRGQAEQAARHTHPPRHALDDGAPDQIGHVEHGADGRRDHRAFAVRKQEGENDEPAVEDAVSDAEGQIEVETEEAEAQANEAGQEEPRSFLAHPVLHGRLLSIPEGISASPER